MPSAHRVSVALSEALSLDLDRLARLTGRSRAAVVREWLDLAAPTLKAIADVMDAAAVASGQEREEIIALLDGIADELAGKLGNSKGSPERRRAAESGRERADGGEPPTSNTGVPNGGYGGH
ncbi:MAG: CopG family transcriptional regulator [bacterium]